MRACDQGTSDCADGDVNNMGNSNSSRNISAQDKCVCPPFLCSIPRCRAKLTCFRAILDMKNQRDKLHQYQKRITVLTDREKEIAKECLSKGDTNRAKLALRRKKYQESLLAKTDAQLAQLEQLTSDVEFALIQKDVLYGLQEGTAVLKEIHKEMGGIENVEKLLGESEEARAYQEVRIHQHKRIAVDSLLNLMLQEISELLANKMSNQDEDEVEDELEALEREVNGVQTGVQNGVPVLPDAPVAQPELTPEQKAKAQRARRARERERQAADEGPQLVPA
jgi:charged multivesicular body protein 6